MSIRAPGRGLSQSVVSGVKWNFASQGGQQMAQLLTTLWLARVLMPADFGLVGMAIVVVGLVSLFKDLGTSAAIIQSRETTDELLSTVFWANLAFAAAGTLAIIAAAPWAAMYYREPRVTAVLQVLALNFMISGCSIQQQALFERKLLFAVLAKVEFAGVVCGTVAGIGSAVSGAGLWSLVAQSLTSTCAVSILLWKLSDWRPRLRFRWAELRRISNYSLHLTGFGTVNYFARNADYLLIGRCLGAASLGTYTLAYRIMLYPLQTITTVVSRVMFPVYSRLQDDDARFRAAYLRTAGMIALLTFPLMAGLWLVAERFVLSFFGARWALVIPLVKILAPVGLAQSVVATVGAIYQAKGRTAALMCWGMGSSLLDVLGFLVGVRWGVLGVATAYAITSLALAVPGFAIPFRFIGLRLPEFAAVLLRPLLASLFMLLAVVVMRVVLAGASNVAALQALVATGVLAYIGASWLVNREQFRQVLALVAGKS